MFVEYFENKDSYNYNHKGFDIYLNVKNPTVKTIKFQLSQMLPNQLKAIHYTISGIDMNYQIIQKC